MRSAPNTVTRAPRSRALLIGLEAMAYGQPPRLSAFPSAPPGHDYRAAPALRHLMGITEDKGTEAAVERLAA